MIKHFKDKKNLSKIRFFTLVSFFEVQDFEDMLDEFQEPLGESVFRISIILMCVIFLVFLEFFNILIRASLDNSNFVFIITDGITLF